MAIYDMNAAIDKPNLWASFQQGRMQGQAMQQNALALQASRQQADDRNALRTLAPGIIAGDPNAYDQASAIDPQAAAQYGQAGDAKLLKLRNVVDYIDRAKQTGNQAAVSAAMAQAWPFIRQVVPNAPEQPPSQFTPEMEQGWEALKAKVAMAGTPKAATAPHVVGQALVDETGKVIYQAPQQPEYQWSDRAGAWIPKPMGGGQPSPGAAQQMPPDSGVPLGSPVLDSGQPFYSAVEATIAPLGGRVTSTNSGQHNVGSLHGSGGAIDIGMGQESPERQQAILAALQADPRFIVRDERQHPPGQAVWSGPHLHIERAQNMPQGAAPANTGLHAIPVAGIKPKPDETFVPLSPEEVARAGLPPGTFAQRDTVTGELKFGPAAVQAVEKPMSAFQQQQLQIKSGKAKAALSGTVADLDRMGDAVRKVMNSPGLNRITGLMGALPNIPGSAAANAEADLDALKSQIAFAVLAKMRAMSPTGGALGSVSDAEGKRLEANLAALDKAQSADQMRARLQDILDYIESSKGNLRDAYDEQFSGPQPSAPAAPADHGVDDLLSKYGVK